MIIEKCVKKGYAVTAYNVLSRASFNSLTARERVSCVKILRELKNISIAHDDLKDELLLRLRPDNFDEIEHTRKKLKLMSDEDRAEQLQDANIRKQITDYDDYLTAVDYGLHDFLAEDITLHYEPLPEDVAIKLLDSNPSWNAAATELVYDIVSGII